MFRVLGIYNFGTKAGHMTPLVLILLLTDMQINLAPERVLERGTFGKMWCGPVELSHAPVSSVVVMS